MAKKRGIRRREEYIARTDGVEMSPNKSYIRLSNWSLDVPTFIDLAENGFLLPNKSPKDKCKGRRFGTHNDQTFKVNGLRLSTFKLKGVTCVECGVVGEVFHLEKPIEKEPYHLNLYGFKDGEEVMLTQDHVRPKSRGGKDHMDNSQTMCKQCNESKGSTWVFDLLEGETYYRVMDYRILSFKLVDIREEDYTFEFTEGGKEICSKNLAETYCKNHILAVDYPHAEECLREQLNAELRVHRDRIVSLMDCVSMSNQRVNEYHVNKKKEKEAENA